MSNIRTRRETGAIGQRLPDGVTYRALDYWTRLGYLHPENGGTPGSRCWRRWPDSELEAAAMIARLRAVGIELGIAAKAARELLAAPDRTTVLPGGFVIATVEEPGDEHLDKMEASA